ncbi:hypothetical protein [Brevibacillus centrosporus]|uniref:hypothetical protein n=1 Tax=Brevibacillus centrosporus TaxID=54910 RepID=UPI0039858BE6
MKAEKRSAKLPGGRQRKMQEPKPVRKKSTRQINRSENRHDYQEENENEITIAPTSNDHRELPPSPPPVQVPKHLLRSDPKQPVEDLSLTPFAPETIPSEPEHLTPCQL